MVLEAFVVEALFIRCGLMNPENNWMKVKEPGAHMDCYVDKRHKLWDPKRLDYKNLPDQRKAPNYFEDEKSE